MDDSNVMMIHSPLHLMKPPEEFGLYSFYPGEHNHERQNPYCYPGEEEHLLVAPQQQQPAICEAEDRRRQRQQQHQRPREERRRAMSGATGGTSMRVPAGSLRQLSASLRASSSFEIPEEIVAASSDHFFVDASGDFCGDDDVSTISDHSTEWADELEHFVGLGDGDCDDARHDQSLSSDDNDCVVDNSWTIEVQEPEENSTRWFKIYRSNNSRQSPGSGNSFIMLEGAEVLQSIKALISFMSVSSKHRAAAARSADDASSPCSFQLHCLAEDITVKMSAKEALTYFQELLSASSKTPSLDEDSNSFFIDRFIHTVVATAPPTGTGRCSNDKIDMMHSSFESSSSFPIDLIYDYE